MKILINKDIYGWRMTGLLGKNGKWFIGYSKARDLNPVMTMPPGDLRALTQLIGDCGAVIPDPFESSLYDFGKKPGQGIQSYWPETVRKNFERSE